MTKKPKEMQVLRVIDHLDSREGNALFKDIQWWFCRVNDYTPEALHDVLDALQTKRLVVRDGLSNRGVHYALTFEGRMKVLDAESDAA
jgi:hypothetical protein